MKRFLLSTAVGVLLASSRLIALKLQLTGVVRNAATALWMPGGYVGLLAAHGRIDDIDFGFADVVNFAVYFALTFLVLTILTKRRAKEIRPA